MQCAARRATWMARRVSSVMSVLIRHPPVFFAFQRLRKRQPAQGRGDGKRLNRVRPPVAGADPDRLLDGQHEDLAVADAAGARGVLDRLDDIVDAARPRPRPRSSPWAGSR